MLPTTQRCPFPVELPPTPPPFIANLFIQSSHETRTDGSSRVSPRSESTSIRQFVAVYFGR